MAEIRQRASIDRQSECKRLSLHAMMNLCNDHVRPDRLRSEGVTQRTVVLVGGDRKALGLMKFRYGD